MEKINFIEFLNSTGYRLGGKHKCSYDDDDDKNLCDGMDCDGDKMCHSGCCWHGTCFDDDACEKEGLDIIWWSVTIFAACLILCCTCLVILCIRQKLRKKRENASRRAHLENLNNAQEINVVQNEQEIRIPVMPMNGSYLQDAHHSGYVQQVMQPGPVYQPDPEMRADGQM